MAMYCYPYLILVGLLQKSPLYIFKYLEEQKILLKLKIEAEHEKYISPQMANI